MSGELSRFQSVLEKEIQRESSGKAFFHEGTHDDGI